MGIERNGTALIRTLALTKDATLLHNSPLERLRAADIEWYWVDFDSPSHEEAALLDRVFHFHPLAIEDCLHFLQRPKMDYYGDYNFFVLHALNQRTLDAEEVDLFVGGNYVVSFHLQQSEELEEVWEKISVNEAIWAKGPVYIAYLVMDKLVDQYFPAVYLIEEAVDKLDDNLKRANGNRLMDELFDIRGDLLKLRRTINTMRDLLYRILNSERLAAFKEHHVYFVDIHDHLLRLSELIESNREMTADIRDSYTSFNSNRMNSIMMTLTIISSIFIPLTFIAGVYGMNFEFMPELKSHYGYFIVLIVMVLIGVGMYLWFRRKGWFKV